MVDSGSTLVSAGRWILGSTNPADAISKQTANHAKDLVFEPCASLFTFTDYTPVWGMWSYGIGAIPQSALLSGTHSRYLYLFILGYSLIKGGSSFSFF